MTGADVVQMFEEKRPVCVMAQMALERLLSAEELDRLFHETAQHQYERDLLFSTLAKLMATVVLCRERTLNAAYKKMKEQVGVSLNATYSKLDRVELGLSQAVVRYAYQQLRNVSDHLGVVKPSPVAGLQLKILDGNHLAGTEHRLLETRNSTAAPLPGKTLVVLDPQREAIADLFPIEDGHAQERSALDQVIETIDRLDLWVADRNFCTLKWMYAIDLRGARFVIRQHDKLQGEPLGKHRSRGKTATGKVNESQLKLTEYAGHTLTVRCIEVELDKPTRDGDRSLRILTNLTEDEADALHVAEIYRGRWQIETAFQKLTTTLQCEINTLCYPRAAIFAFSLACLAYNAVSLVLSAICREHGRKKTEQLSFYYMSLEIAQAHDGMMVAVPPSHWRKIARLTLDDFTQHLRKVSRCIDFEYFRKAKRRPRKPKPKIKHRRRQVHFSTAQLLAQRKQQNAC
jgi:IS4 transposase